MKPGWPAAARPEISTRRKHPNTGTVHEMADFGTGTMCGRDLPEPWDWTEEPISCKRCLKAIAAKAGRT